MIRNTKLIKHSIFLAGLLILSAAMTGCGIKPDFPDAPEGYEDTEYPQQYPAEKPYPGENTSAPSTPAK